LSNEHAFVSPSPTSRFRQLLKSPSVLAEQAIAQASLERAGIVCFPECFVPGYRAVGKAIPPPDPAFLERAWSAIAEAAKKANIDGDSRHGAAC